MFKHFFTLQWKSFFRAASLKTNLVLKIFMFFVAIYFITIMVGGGVGTYFFIEEKLKMDPLQVINKFLLYWFVLDLVVRYFFQKMPVLNIKPLLYLPIKKNRIVTFTLGKTIISFFNIIHAFYFIPLAVTMILKGYPIANVLGWQLAIMAIIYFNNFINILISNKDVLFYSMIAILLSIATLQYYNIFDVTVYAEPIMRGFYENPITAAIPWLLVIILFIISFKYFKNNLFLDAGLSQKKSDAVTEDLTWLNRFGSIAVFLKNDIK